MDTLLILILTALVIGISAILFRDRKNGGCASCPHNDNCSTREKCTENSEG